MPRGGRKTRGLSADEVEDLGLRGPAVVSGEEVPVDPGLGLVLEARESVEVELEEALSVPRAEGVGEEEPQELALVVRRASEGAESRERRHDGGRRSGVGANGRVADAKLAGDAIGWRWESRVKLHQRGWDERCLVPDVMHQLRSDGVTRPWAGHAGASRYLGADRAADCAQSSSAAPAKTLPRSCCACPQAYSQCRTLTGNTREARFA